MNKQFNQFICEAFRGTRNRFIRKIGIYTGRISHMRQPRQNAMIWVTRDCLLLESPPQGKLTVNNSDILLNSIKNIHRMQFLSIVSALVLNELRSIVKELKRYIKRRNKRTKLSVTIVRVAVSNLHR